VVVVASLDFAVEVDVNSGRLRRQTYLWSYVISNVIEDTEFSTWAARFGQVHQPAEWHHEQYHGILFNGGGYRYGSTSIRLREFVLVCKMYQIDDASKRKAMARVMEMLRQGQLRDIYDFNSIELPKLGKATPLPVENY
jgi:hypothetical protein